MGVAVSCVGASSEYVRDAERATNTPKTGAIRSEKIHPIMGMPPIPATIIEHTKITINHRM